jgi:hypothetical protein
VAETAKYRALEPVSAGLLGCEFESAVRAFDNLSSIVLAFKP